MVFDRETRHQLNLSKMKVETISYFLKDSEKIVFFLLRGIEIIITYKWPNKLECLSLEGFSCLVYYLQVSPGAYPGVERLKGVPLR
jgi:hypothetical protein